MSPPVQELPIAYKLVYRTVCRFAVGGDMSPPYRGACELWCCMRIGENRLPRRCAPRNDIIGMLLPVIARRLRRGNLGDMVLRGTTAVVSRNPSPWHNMRRAVREIGVYICGYMR